MKFDKLIFALIPLLIFAALAAPQSARVEGRDAILVLDASGSMWGEVSGRYKIEIAREVVADVVATLPENTRLGLMVYGHNHATKAKVQWMLSYPSIPGRSKSHHPAVGNH